MQVLKPLSQVCVCVCPQHLHKEYCYTVLLLAHQKISQQYMWLLSLSQLCRKPFIIADN